MSRDSFDNLLMEHVAKIFHKQHEVDLLADLRSRNRLWSAVEKAKRELSDMPYVSIAALIHAKRSWNLKHSASAAKTAFMACLLMKKFDEATQWYSRLLKHESLLFC